MGIQCLLFIEFFICFFAINKGEVSLERDNRLIHIYQKKFKFADCKFIMQQNRNKLLSENLVMSQDPIKRCLEVVGDKNRYQLILIAVLCLVFYVQVFPILGPSFYYMDPIFKCKGQDDIVNEKNACPKLDECTLINDYTIVGQLGLYCDRQGERDLIQSFLSVGSMIGLFLMNFVSDIKGRKYALIIALGLSIVGIFFTIIGAYSQIVTFLVLGALLSGYGGYASYTICYIILGEFCQNSLRQKATIFLNIAYSFGLITLDVFYNWIQQWYNITVLFILIPLCGMFVVVKLLVLESPYYYYSINQKQKAADIIMEIGAYNNREQSKSVEVILASSTQQSKAVTASQSMKLFFQTFKNLKYLAIIILAALTEAGGNLFYFGIQFAIDDIGFSYGVDNIVLGTTQIVASLVMTRFITNLPRKKSAAISYFTVGLLSFLFIIPAIYDSPIFCTILIICIRILTTLGYYMIVMIQTQSFPAEIQSVGAGSIQALSQTGSIIAPIVIATAINLDLNKIASMGVLTILLTISIKFVPEPNREQVRHHKDLEDSLLGSTLQ